MDTHCRRYTAARKCRCGRIAWRCGAASSPANERTNGKLFKRALLLSNNHFVGGRCKKYVEAYLIAFIRRMDTKCSSTQLFLVFHAWEIQNSSETNMSLCILCLQTLQPIVFNFIPQPRLAQICNYSEHCLIDKTDFMPIKLLGAQWHLNLKFKIYSTLWD